MNPNYPSYPPQPVPGAQPYPPYPSANSQPSPYPPGQPGFNAGGYPPQPTGQPQPGGYPPQPTGQPQPGGYPSQPTGQSQPGGFYPPAGGPPQPGTYAPQYGYPSQPASYPPSQQASYPPSASSFAPPPQQQAYPSHSISSIWEKPGYPLSAQAQAGYHPPPNPSHQPSSYPSQGYAPTNMHQSGGHQEQLSPTVRPASPFDPRADAEVLRKAMKGFGTDEQAIINVLTRRSNSQRQEIAVQFKGMYGKDLIENLKSELSGKFEDLIVALMTPLPVYLAGEVQHAIEGIGTNEQTLIEILCSATNAEIFAIKNAYTRVFGRSLENDLGSDTSGHFKRLLVSVVQGCRNESPMVDDAAAGRDAQALLSAGIMMFGTDESTFNAILCSRSYPQLRRVMAEYQRLSGHSLEQAIRSEFSGDIQEGLLAIVQCANDRATYFAGRLRDAVACVGTKDRQLIRVVVSRCEIDMQNIKRAYQKCFNQSVETDITNDTSGDYKRALLALVSG